MIRRTFCAAALVACFAPHAVAAEPTRADILTTAARAGQFKTLVSAVVAAGLDAPLKGEGHFTVFAPTDEAFAKLPKGTVETLLKPENKDKLRAILLYHVVSGNLTARDAVATGTVSTAQGGAVTVNIVKGRLTVNDATASATDLSAPNGVIHVIDRVLLPK